MLICHNARFTIIKFLPLEVEGWLMVVFRGLLWFQPPNEYNPVYKYAFSITAPALDTFKILLADAI